MIERIFAFCFGNQLHKYAVLVLAASLATIFTIDVVGIAAAPANVFLTAGMTIILAFPISSLLRVAGMEAHSLTLSRKLAVRLGRGIGIDDSFAGDLEEYYGDLRERFGVHRANMWYRLQILVALCNPRLRPLRLWQVVLLLVGIEGYLTLSHYTFGDTFAVVPHLSYTIPVIIVLLTAIVSGLMKIGDDFDEFRSRRGSSEKK